MTTAPPEADPRTAAGPPAVLERLCTLDDAGRAVRWRIVEQVIASAVDRDALSDGVRFTFVGHGPMARHIIEFIQLERACCARFTYDVEDGPGGLVTLLIRAHGADVSALKALYLHARP